VQIINQLAPIVNRNSKNLKTSSFSDRAEATGMENEIEAHRKGEGLIRIIAIWTTPD